MTEMGSVEFAVYADKIVKPVLVTSDKGRALRALDALFDSREYVTNENRVSEGRIEVNGVVIERRSAHPALRMLEKKEAAIHHHAATGVKIINSEKPSASEGIRIDPGKWR